MDVRKTITARLTREDIEEAINEWLEKKGLSIIDIYFDMSSELGDDQVLDGASCTVKQKDP